MWELVGVVVMEVVGMVELQVVSSNGFMFRTTGGVAIQSYTALVKSIRCRFLDTLPLRCPTWWGKIDFVIDSLNILDDNGSFSNFTDAVMSIFSKIKFAVFVSIT